MIEMRVGKNDRVELPVAQRTEVRQRFVAFQLRMHSTIEHEPLSGGFEVITIRADLSPAREIEELHENDEFPNDE